MVRTRFAPGDGTIERARRLRRDASPAEQRFWAMVRNRAVDGCKFRRQQRLGPFIADFVCQDARLVIEIDGDTHAGAAAEACDASRSAFMIEEGYRVLRFSNADVLGNLDGVARSLRAALAPSPSHSAEPSGPLPLPRGGEEA